MPTGKEIIMHHTGQYIYAIISDDGPIPADLKSIGTDAYPVYTVVYRDIGAVVSNTPIFSYPVSRSNTMAHQKVMEAVMQTHTLLPVRFGTIAGDVDQIRQKLLAARYAELSAHLRHMQDKIELGLKVLWKDMNVLFQEIVSENREIRQIRDRLATQKGISQQARVRLGEMVKKSLERKREKEGNAVLEGLRGYSVDRRSNKLFGDLMVVNGAFLVLKQREKEFDAVVENLASHYEGRMTFRYVGPVPPANFVEITVRW
jgi:hypothetical protein